MQTARQACLRQKHCAEFSRADHPNLHRPAFGVTLHQKGVQIHRMIETRATQKDNADLSRRPVGCKLEPIQGKTAMIYSSPGLTAGKVMLCLMIGFGGTAHAQSGGQGSWTPKAALDMARNEVVA